MIPARIICKNDYGYTHVIHGSFIRNGDCYTIFRFGHEPLTKDRKKVIKVEPINLNK